MKSMQLLQSQITGRFIIKNDVKFLSHVDDSGAIYFNNLEEVISFSGHEEWRYNVPLMTLVAPLVRYEVVHEFQSIDELKNLKTEYPELFI